MLHNCQRSFLSVCLRESSLNRRRLLVLFWAIRVLARDYTIVANRLDLISFWPTVEGLDVREYDISKLPGSCYLKLYRLYSPVLLLSNFVIQQYFCRKLFMFFRISPHYSKVITSHTIK